MSRNQSKKRVWPYIVGGVLALGIIGQFGDSDTEEANTASTSTTRTSSTTHEASASGDDALRTFASQQPAEEPAPIVEAAIPVPEPVVEVAPAPAVEQAASAPVIHQAAPAPAPASAHYKNCTAVWNAIGSPIYVGDPGYASHLDRDGDGIGCEKDPR
jgi:Excalibur calcium-binding domain.